MNSCCLTFCSSSQCIGRTFAVFGVPFSILSILDDLNPGLCQLTMYPAMLAIVLLAFAILIQKRYFLAHPNISNHIYTNTANTSCMRLSFLRSLHTLVLCFSSRWQIQFCSEFTAHCLLILFTFSETSNFVINYIIVDFAELRNFFLYKKIETMLRRNVLELDQQLARS